MRIYLDYNATSPLVDNVKTLLAGGDFLFANPSSQHSSGKKAKHAITEVGESLFAYFSLAPEQFNLFYHSGATEGINTIFNLGPKDALVYFESDHPAVLTLAKQLDQKGILTVKCPITKDGSFDIDDCIKKINSIQDKDSIWLNYTFMHNETGIKWDLNKAKKIKEQTAALIHVDAVQSVGKLDTARDLLPQLDAYTYSAHKFGALKGIGFTFIRSKHTVKPLIVGGQQQGSMRAGTINTHGILSIGAAIKFLNLCDDFLRLNKLKQKIITILESNSNIEVIKNDSCNTVCFVHTQLKADLLLVHFDMAMLDVSSGSACSAGSFKPSQTLIAMGYKDRAANNIRISLGHENLGQEEQIKKRLTALMTKL